MGPWLLAIENLAFALLCVGLVFSLIARSPARWQRNLLRLIPLTFLLCYLTLAAWAAYVHAEFIVTFGLRQHLILGFLLVGYLLGIVVLWRRARRVRFNEETLETISAAQRWSPGKLAWIAIGLLGLQTITWSALNSVAMRKLQRLRMEAEARALALTPGKPTDKKNAALVYEQAFALLPKDEEWGEQIGKWWATLDEIPPTLDVADPELTAFFQQQASTLALLYQAAELPACHFEHDYIVPGFDFPVEEPMQLRKAASLLSLHAYTVSREGDLQAAIRDLQTVYRMAEHEGSDPCLISQLVSYAMEGAVHHTLQQLLSGRQPTVEELSPLQFNPVYSRTRGLTRGFRMEETFGLYALSQFNSAISIHGIGLSPVLPLPLLKLYPVFLLDDDVDVYHEYLQQYIQCAALPYSQAIQQAEAIEAEMYKNKRGFGAMIIMANLSSPIRASATAAANHYTAQTAVAVHRFRADEGKLPQQLTELVPKYLPAVPLDPFDDLPLRWKVTGDEWVVYSIGRNLIDDGGTMTDDYPPKSDICFYSRLPEKEPEEQP